MNKKVIILGTTTIAMMFVMFLSICLTIAYTSRQFPSLYILMFISYGWTCFFTFANIKPFREYILSHNRKE